MASSEEARSLKGNVLFHSSFQRNYDFPAFMRSAACRVVSGTMLLSGIVSALACVVTEDSNSRIGCAICTGVSIVAFYHYDKIVKIRDQTGTRMTLTKPGEPPTNPSDQLKLGWQEMHVDAVRYSDWACTLPFLLIELHILLNDAISPVWFSVSWATALITLMIAFGAYTRFGTDELVPIHRDQKNSLLDRFARITGALSFLAACALISLVLYNLLGNVNSVNDPTNGWIYAFSLVWIGYGIVALVAIFVRQIAPNGYPEWLSVFKDTTFGSLDVFSKAIFGIWVSATALGVADSIFTRRA